MQTVDYPDLEEFHVSSKDTLAIKIKNGWACSIGGKDGGVLYSYLLGLVPNANVGDPLFVKCSMVIWNCNCGVRLS